MTPPSPSIEQPYPKPNVVRYEIGILIGNAGIALALFFSPLTGTAFKESHPQLFVIGVILAIAGILKIALSAEDMAASLYVLQWLPVFKRNHCDLNINYRALSWTFQEIRADSLYYKISYQKVALSIADSLRQKRGSAEDRLIFRTYQKFCSF